MVVYSYRVAHLETGRNEEHKRDSAALSSVQLLRAYTDTAEAFNRFFRSLPIFGASCRAAEPTTAGLDITLDTSLDKLSVQNIVSSFLSDMNKSTPGLFLTATRDYGVGGSAGVALANSSYSLRSFKASS